MFESNFVKVRDLAFLCLYTDLVLFFKNRISTLSGSLLKTIRHYDDNFNFKIRIIKPATVGK